MGPQTKFRFGPGSDLYFQLLWAQISACLQLWIDHWPVIIGKGGRELFCSGQIEHSMYYVANEIPPHKRDLFNVAPGDETAVVSPKVLYCQILSVTTEELAFTCLNSVNCLLRFYTHSHGLRQWGLRGLCPPWIFKHGTNIVDRGLKVLFFGLFCYFSVFFFSLPPPWKFFSADALSQSLLLFFYLCRVKRR